MELNDDAINLKTIRFSHAGGSVQAQGDLRNELSSNPFSFKATLIQVDLSQVLDAFNNFGQKAINGKNIQGMLSADVNLKGEADTKTTVDSRQYPGTN